MRCSSGPPPRPAILGQAPLPQHLWPQAVWAPTGATPWHSNPCLVLLIPLLLGRLFPHSKMVCAQSLHPWEPGNGGNLQQPLCWLTLRGPPYPSHRERERREKEREEWERQYSRQSRSPSPRYSEFPGQWAALQGTPTDCPGHPAHCLLFSLQVGSTVLPEGEPTSRPPPRPTPAPLYCLLTLPFSLQAFEVTLPKPPLPTLNIGGDGVC